jgi:hypothetical protein
MLRFHAAIREIPPRRNIGLPVHKIVQNEKTDGVRNVNLKVLERAASRQ